MIRRPIAFCLLIMLAGPATAQQKESEKDRAALSGVWILTEANGRTVPRQANDKIVVEGGKFDSSLGSFERFTLDTTKSPRQITLELNAGGMKMSWPGIYKIDGDTLHICLSKIVRRGAGKTPPVLGNMPTKFDVTEGITVVAERSDERKPIAVIGDLKIHQSHYAAVAVSSDSKTAAFGFLGNVVLWDLPSNQFISRIPDLGGFKQLDFSTDGKWLAIGRRTKDGAQAILWDRANETISRKFAKGYAFCTFTPDSKYLILGSGSDVTFVDPNTGRVEKKIDVKAVAAFVNEHGLLLEYDDKIHLWDWRRNQKIREFTFEMKDPGTTNGPSTGEKVLAEIRRATLSDDGKRIAGDVPTAGEKLVVWDVQTGNIVSEIDFRNGSMEAFYPGSHRVIVTHVQGTRVFDGDTGKFVTGYERSEVTASVAASPDGKYILSAGGEGGEIIPVRQEDQRELVRYPPALTKDVARALKQLVASDQVFAVGWDANYRNDVKGTDGKSILSWRVKMLEQINPQLFRKFDRKRSWNSNKNKKFANRKTLPAAIAGPPRGSAVWQKVIYDELAVANGAQSPTDNGAQSLAGNGAQSLAGNGAQAKGQRITWVHAKLRNNVPWTAPQDFRFNKESPWDGLPRDGFFAYIFGHGAVFIDKDTPDNQLRNMFDPNTPIKSDDVEAALDRFLFPTADRPVVLTAPAAAIQPSDLGSQPAPHQRPENVQIISAKFGYESKWVDVTGKIKKVFAGKTGEFMNSRKAYNAMKLSYKKAKRLVIELNVDGNQKTVTIKENWKTKTNLFEALK